MNLQMSRRFYAGLVLALVSSSSLVGRAEPTPSGVPLRPLSTDRPDVTESPNTVDAGHFQLEAELARVSDDEDLRTYGFGHTNLKVGLAHFWDFQLVVESLVGLEVDDGYDWGFGDVTLRTKLNLFEAENKVRTGMVIGAGKPEGFRGMLRQSRLLPEVWCQPHIS